MNLRPTQDLLSQPHFKKSPKRSIYKFRFKECCLGISACFTNPMSTEGNSPRKVMTSEV